MNTEETTSRFGFVPQPRKLPLIECSREVYNIIEEQLPELKFSAKFTTSLDDNPDAILLGTEQFTEFDLKSRPKLRCISRIGTGVDNIELPYNKLRSLLALEIVWTVEAVVEYDVRELYRYLMEIATNKSIHDLTVGIVGCNGRIGSAIQRKLKDKVGRVMGNDVTFSCCPDFKALYKLEDLQKNCDAIFVHIPSTAENRGFINRSFLERFDGDIVIAPVRDAVVDWNSIRHMFGVDLVVDCELPSDKMGLTYVRSTHHSATRLPYYYLKMIRSAVENAVCWVGNVEDK